MVNVWFSFSIDFLEAIKYIAQNRAAANPVIIPNKGMVDILSSKTRVIRKHPRIAKHMHNIFFKVIFSSNIIYANINTKIGAVESSTAASDNGIVFIDSL